MTGADAGSGECARTPGCRPSAIASGLQQMTEAAARQSSRLPSAASWPNMRARRATLSSIDLAAAIGGGVQIEVIRQFAENAAHVGHCGKILARQALHAAFEDADCRDAHHGRARQARIDELAAGQPIGIRQAARIGLAALNGNDVGRRRAEVDEQRISESGADGRGGGQEVCRADVGGIEFGFLAPSRSPSRPSRTGRLGPNSRTSRSTSVSTPVLRSGKRSESSPVIVTACREARASSGCAAASAASSLSMPCHSGHTNCSTAITRPSSTSATLRCAPPTSRPACGHGYCSVGRSERGHGISRLRTKSNDFAGKGVGLRDESLRDSPLTPTYVPSV